MKVLIYNSININPNLGGVERVVDVLIKEFIKQNLEIEVVYLKKIKCESDDSSIIQIQLPSAEGDSKLNKNFIVSLLESNHYSLVYNVAAIFNRGCRCIMEACIEKKVPIVNVYHNSLDFQVRKINVINHLLRYNPTKWMIKKALHLIQNLPYYKGGNWNSRNSSAQIVLSETYKKDFISIIDKKPKNLKAIYNPLPFKSYYNNENKENIALFVGRLEPQKNVSRLIRIWKQIKPTTKEWKLLILGEGSEKVTIENLIRELELENHVILMGQRDPVPYYKRAKIFCMTSNYEGYPMTLIECQAFGVVPVLFDSFNAASEIINNGDNGFLIKSNNDLQFAEKINTLMENENLRNSMALKALSSVNNLFPEKIANDWIELFEKVIARCKV